MEKISLKNASGQRKENTTISVRHLEDLYRHKYENRKEEQEGMDFEEYESFIDGVLDANVPPRFKGARITEGKIRDIIASSDPSRGIYIYGSCGTGKTRNLWGIWKTLMAHKKQNEMEENYYVEKSDGAKPAIRYPQITTISDFLSELKTTFQDADSERRIVEKITTRDILLIDDFGTEKMSEWTEEITYRLINHRYNYMKPTFFTSNLSIRELAERVGDRIASRIVEMCHVVKIEGEDMRLKK